jgi:neutral ceramidase
VNRSLIAYQENPADERARYVDNTNTNMTLLKFVDDTGAVGMINWYALHPTAMNYYNRLVSGDHKGYASLQMERQFGGTGSPGDFVAAFAQADPGDVTPNTNLDNTGPGATDVETTRIMGDRQLQVAQQLFDEATEKLSGPVDTRHIYVDLSHYAVEPRFTGQGTQHTCPSAYGYSFAGGSTEDGGGHFLFREGMTEQSLWRDWLIRLVLGTSGWTESVRACQAPKPILLETGTGDPPLQSQIRSIALARIGQLVILGLPAEVTTMAGRRLRDTVMAELGDWAGHIVLAGYVNGYAGYITTPQEYMIQQYEAGHTLHGRWTLPAYQQVAAQLAAALEQGKLVTADIAYDDWRDKSVGRPLPDGVVGEPPQGRQYGEARPVLAGAYRPGETPVAEFWSANPTLHYLTGENYLRVERKGISGWQVVAEDGDWATTLRWVVEDDAYVARASWTIPEDAAPGDYRFSHSGLDPSGKRFSGSSTLFRVVPRGP